MDNQPGTLLPLSAITAELLNQVSIEQTEHDSSGVEPAWWAQMVEVFKEAAKEDVSGGVGNALFPSVVDMIEEHGSSLGPSLVIKSMILGWRMAELHLQQSL